ncbi:MULTISPECIES: hypothetical protein [Rhodococcus]|uniref:Uncharacterized protein n=1 Tax=Rhodococcus cerastii TaxID=908616 RepID=A0ABU4D1X9_9NOCA|nr:MULTISPECIES: hypothetical protein [Rhodococcus]MDV6303725.1 hypothetical protein [Rhodococcus cerastii]MDV8058270.1 hypothetical protein [Rhodococcus sp. IEGM 1343]
MTDICNPAYRLHTILTKIRNANADISLRDNLRPLLDAETHAEVFTSIGRLLALPDETEKALIDAANRTGLDVNSAQFMFYRRWHPTVSKALHTAFYNLAGPTSAVSRVIDVEEMASLEAAHYWLQNLTTHPPVTTATLVELRERVTQLIAEIYGSNDLDEQLRYFVTEQLGRVIAALDAAELVGTRVVQSSADEVHGAMIRTLTNTGIPTTPEGRTLLQKVGKLLAAITLATGAAGGMLVLPSQAKEAWEVFAGEASSTLSDQPASTATNTQR